MLVCPQHFYDLLNVDWGKKKHFTVYAQCRFCGSHLVDHFAVQPSVRWAFVHSENNVYDVYVVFRDRTRIQMTLEVASDLLDLDTHISFLDTLEDDSTPIVQEDITVIASEAPRLQTDKEVI